MSDTPSAAPAAQTSTPDAASSAPSSIAGPNLESMSGAELKAYFEAQKTKQPAAPNAKQTNKPTSAAIQKPEEQSNAESIAEAAAVAKRKLKIDDEEIDEDEVIKTYRERKGHQRAANKELQEGKAARKQAEQLVSMLKDEGKLFEALQKIGHNPRNLAEKYLAAQIQEELLDPKERELRDARTKLERYEAEERAKLEQVEQQRLAEMKTKYAKQFESEFVEALKESKLPPSKHMVAEMARYIARGAKIGFKMSPAEAAQLVKEDLKQSQLAILGESDGETLLRLLGDDAAAKILQARGAKVRSPESNLRTPEAQSEPRERHAASGRMSAKEWRNYNRGK